MIGIAGMVAGMVECMAETRNDSERLRMRAGMGMDMEMNDILMAVLDEGVRIIWSVMVDVWTGRQGKRDRTKKYDSI